MVLHRYWKTLLAVVAGNFLYFAALAPYLPPAARHRRGQFAWGLVGDFWTCLVVHGLLSFVVKPSRKKD